MQNIRYFRACQLVLRFDFSNLSPAPAIRLLSNEDKVGQTRLVIGDARVGTRLFDLKLASKTRACIRKCDYICTAEKFSPLAGVIEGLVGRTEPVTELTRLDFKGGVIE